MMMWRWVNERCFKAHTRQSVVFSPRLQHRNQNFVLISVPRVLCLHIATMITNQAEKAASASCWKFACRWIYSVLGVGWSWWRWSSVWTRACSHPKSSRKSENIHIYLFIHSFESFVGSVGRNGDNPNTNKRRFQCQFINEPDESFKLQTVKARLTWTRASDTPNLQSWIMDHICFGFVCGSKKRCWMIQKRLQTFLGLSS